MIATPTLTYIHADDKLSAIDRQAYLSLRVEQSTLQAELKAIRKAIADATLAGEQDGVNQATTEFESKNLRLARISEELPMCEKWSVPCRFPHALILVGEHLVAGGSDELAVLSVLDGSPLATVPVLGNAYGLAAAKGRLYVSTDRGVVHCFTGTTQ